MTTNGGMNNYGVYRLFLPNLNVNVANALDDRNVELIMHTDILVLRAAGSAEDAAGLQVYANDRYKAEPGKKQFFTIQPGSGYTTVKIAVVEVDGVAKTLTIKSLTATTTVE